MTTYARLIEPLDFWLAGLGGLQVWVYRPGRTTLATIWSDSAMEHELEQPLTMASRTFDGVVYGKAAVHVYVNEAYELVWSDGNRTGIIRNGLLTVDGEDISDAEAKSARGDYLRPLSALFDNLIFAADYGELGTDRTVNTATINAALGAAAAQPGGAVVLPAGVYPVSPFSIAGGVVLCGQERGATTLTFGQAAECVTLSGDRCGIARLTIDGLSLIASSVGLVAKGREQPILLEAEVKRFDLGIDMRGVTGAKVHDAKVYNCNKGWDCIGDATDGDFTNNRFEMCRIEACTDYGVKLESDHGDVAGNTFVATTFDTISGIALDLIGATETRIEAALWDNCLTAIQTADAGSGNKVCCISVIGGEVSPGASPTAFTMGGDCKSVLFTDTRLKGDIEWALNCDKQIILRDCNEDKLPSLTGETQKLGRVATADDAVFAIQTVNGTGVSIFKRELAPGEIVNVYAEVVGRQVNGTSKGFYFVGSGAYRPGSSLDFDNQTANFVVGETLTGLSSEATAIIQAQSDSGATGTLTLIQIDGDFEDDETITCTGGGSALANGTLTGADVTLDSSGNSNFRAPVESDTLWGCVVAALGTEVLVNVTGAASNTVDWKARVRVTSSEG